MATEPERSQEARLLAETALVRLLVGVDDQDLPLIVLGGLVPEVLTSGQDPAPPQHLGTTDVDIHLALHLDPSMDLAPLERAVTGLGFDRDPKQRGWRWVATIDGEKVKIEFLCDLVDQPAEAIVRPMGCQQLTALNLRGTGFVAGDWEWELITGSMPDGQEVAVRARFAGLQGYLMSKVHVARERGAEKDYYDLVYTLLYNRLGGPTEAALALLSGPFANRIDLSASVWKELTARFASVNDFGPRGYAAEAQRVDPTFDYAQLRQDAVGAVKDFLDELQQDSSTAPRESAIPQARED